MRLTSTTTSCFLRRSTTSLLGLIASSTRLMATDKVCDGSSSSEQALQALWSTSFDGWINVPHHPPGVMYLRPESSVQESTSIMTNNAIPRILVNGECQGGIFALTAFNPLGQTMPMTENVAANERLWAELQQTVKPLYMWKSFGFAQDWREDGFVVAFGDKETKAEAEKQVCDLALKYKQGAIYGFDPIRGKDGDVVGFRRRTIPVAMQNVEADVIVVPCSKPDLENAEVNDI